MDYFFNSNEEMTSNEVDMDMGNIPSYPECNLISSLKLYYKESEPNIIYYWENNHSGEISLGEYFQNIIVFFLKKMTRI